MSEITREDLKIIFSCALQIAKADDDLALFEKKFLFKIFEKIAATPEERNELMKKNPAMEEQIGGLSGREAETLLVKTLCAVAHSDGMLHYAENEFLNRVVGQMGPGIEIRPWDEWIEYEEEVLAFLAALR